MKEPTKKEFFHSQTPIHINHSLYRVLIIISLLFHLFRRKVLNLQKKGSWPFRSQNQQRNFLWNWSGSDSCNGWSSEEGKIELEGIRDWIRWMTRPFPFWRKCKTKKTFFWGFETIREETSTPYSKYLERKGTFWGHLRKPECPERHNWG
jgi:hypothetical protein